MFRIPIGTLVLCAASVSFGADEPNDVGFRIHKLESPNQSAPTQVRVLAPDRIEAGKTPAVIYVLPVEAGEGTRYGDGLLEIKRRGLHNRHGVIFVAPTFADLPWYCDHPTNPKIRQETYFVNEVVPLIEKTYAVQKRPEGQLLLGFSKSGWGAWTLLLRHPDLFGRAAAWDAPLMMEQMGKYGTSEIFGSQENFGRSAITDLLRQKADTLRESKRLILTGYGGFQQEHERAHALLEELRIPHEYRDGPKREHTWHSGWVEEAVGLLLGR